MKRITQLDGVRGLAILAVFIHHAFKVKLLWMGVDLFFILSGFLITGILLQSKELPIGSYFARFYARRARRILAPYVLSLILAGVFFGFFWLKYWYLYILLTNFLYPLHIPRPVAFDPLWSLAVEEQFYLIWPFAVFFLSPKRLRSLSLVLIGLAPIFRGVFHFNEHWAIYTLTPFRMDLMALGAFLQLTYAEHRSWIERWGAQLAIGASVLGVAGLLVLSYLGISTYGNTRIGNVAIYECSLVAAGGLMLWALSGRGVAPLRWGPLRYIGKVSYTIYLVHLGILILLGERFSPVLTAVLGFAIAMTYATVSWYVLEKPLLASGHPKALSSPPRSLVS